MSAALGSVWRCAARVPRYVGARLAIFLIKRKLRRRPFDAELWVVLARLYEVSDRWPEALAALRHARQLNPRSPVVARLLQRIEPLAHSGSQGGVERESSK